MWAFGGRFDVAEPIFARTYRGSASVYDTAWDLYVDGTLAFLRRDPSALERAISQLSEVPKPPGWDRAVGADGKPITLHSGRYGPYVKWEMVNATLPKDVEPDAVTMDMAVALIAEKAAKSGKKKAAPKKKAAAKKTPAKKPAAKKKASATKG